MERSVIHVLHEVESEREREKGEKVEAVSLHVRKRDIIVTLLGVERTVTLYHI